ncbi:hypothetical protein GF323_00585 [Candidatus Woesearchaeota archaeon]|nr:hypothetical protein [Candidatus Woesearchaeota archaeon]
MDYMQSGCDMQPGKRNAEQRYPLELGIGAMTVVLDKNGRPVIPAGYLNDNQPLPGIESDTLSPDMRDITDLLH